MGHAIITLLGFDRAHYPAAVLKDRRSRSGLTKTEWNHKNGDGAHNWGSLRSKGDDELTGNIDAQNEAEVAVDEAPANDMFDFDEELVESAGPDLPADAGNDFKPTAPFAHGDIEGQARVTASPTESTSSFPYEEGRPETGRRMSAVTDEERDRARMFREKGQYKKGGVDLAHIAKTSYGIAQSPTDSYMGAVSPTANKYGPNIVRNVSALPLWNQH
nr:hypothetical protein L203_02371 [Cryptococcus depauperatus CBS 7841]